MFNTMGYIGELVENLYDWADKETEIVKGFCKGFIAGFVDGWLYGTLVIGNIVCL